ncbi:MAG: hypothetical protein HYT39_04095 [Candidatus Sungbacteria bacterium]|nr:hypothetical protein [Candidatus Sungbacteria bacterium]
MKSQHWFCRKCCRRGTSWYNEDEGDFYSVLQLLHDAHQTASPGCDNSNIQVVNGGKITKDEIAEMEKLTPV